MADRRFVAPRPFVRHDPARARLCPAPVTTPPTGSRETSPRRARCLPALIRSRTGNFPCHRHELTRPCRTGGAAGRPGSPAGCSGGWPWACSPLSSARRRLPGRRGRGGAGDCEWRHRVASAAGGVCRLGHTVGAALRRAGFAVTDRRMSATAKWARRSPHFTRALAPGDAAVLYVCGYTVDFGGRDFLLPASANIERDSDALTQGLAAKSVLDALARSGARGRVGAAGSRDRAQGGRPSHLDR